MSPIEKGFLLVEEIARATHGQLLHGDPEMALQSISIDTRTLRPEELYVALKGERFDGHEFFPEALAQRAGALLGRRGSLDPAPHGWSEPTALIEVDDTLYGLGEIARYWRAGHSVPVLGVTGSNGKTTTKEMVATILALSRPTLKTEGNLNNRIGLPLTLMRLKVYHQAAVLEMGTNEPGEIGRLCEIARPQYGLITQVSPAHLEGLGSVEAVAREKGELFCALGKEDTAIVNLDDPWVMRLINGCVARQFTYGRGEGAMVRIIEMDPFYPEGARGVLRMVGEDRQIQMRCHGDPCLQNAVAAAAAALAMGASPDDIVRGLEAFRPSPRRLFVTQLSQGICLIDDTYNANPVSTRAALELLCNLARGRALAILGDMRELGAQAPNVHRVIGKTAADLGVALLISVGEWAEEVRNGAKESSSAPQQVYACASAQQALDVLLEKYSPGDCILVKGSRALALEKVVNGLLASLERNKPLQHRNVG